MIDYLKLKISNLSESDLLRNTFLDWHQNTSLDTGEMIYPIRGHYHNMDIKINPTFKQLSGSIHVLYNLLKTGSKQNYNDFNLCQVNEMIHHINDVFSLDLNKTIIQNLEIGLNIQTEDDPTTILSQNLIVWNFKNYKINNDYNGKGKFIEFETSQYYFKLYDKGKHYNTGTHTLRIEVKIMRNETLNKLGVNCLNDLTDKAKIKALLSFLYKTFEKAVIIDKNPLQALKDAKDKEIIQNGINPLFWTSIKCRKKRQRFKNKFDDIIKKYGLNRIYNEIDNKLKSKGQELLICPVLNNFKNETIEPEKDRMSRFEPYIYFQNETQRKCIITGLDISHQKDDSLFLSECSILKLFDNDKNEFDRLKNSFGPRGKKEFNLKDLCYYMAHNIRNRHSNKRHEIKRKRKKYENSLFPLIEY